MWGYKPSGGRAMTSKERKYVVSGHTIIECTLRKGLTDSGIPLTRQCLDVSQVNAVVGVPFFLLNTLLSEGLVTPIIPFFLKLEWLTNEIKNELNDKDRLTPPQQPNVMEISEWFFESTSLDPWVALLKNQDDRRHDPMSRRDSELSQDFAPSQDEVDASDTPSNQFWGGTQTSVWDNNDHAARSKLLWRADRLKTKTKLAYNDWIAKRFEKLSDMMLPNGMFDLRKTIRGSFDATALRSLYPRELAWASPIAREFIADLRMGAFTLRNLDTELILASLGFNWDKCSDQVFQNIDMRSELLKENLNFFSRGLSANGAKITDHFLQSTLENEQGQ